MRVMNTGPVGSSSGDGSSEWKTPSLPDPPFIPAMAEDKDKVEMRMLLIQNQHLQDRVNFLTDTIFRLQGILEPSDASKTAAALDMKKIVPTRARWDRVKEALEKRHSKTRSELESSSLSIDELEEGPEDEKENNYAQQAEFAFAELNTELNRELKNAGKEV